jgi:ATP-binding cassette subfamily B protein
VNNLITKLKKFFKVFSNLPRALSLILAVGRGWILLQIGLLIIRGVLPACTVYLTKHFIDTLLLTINSAEKSQHINQLIQIGVLFAVTILATEIIGSLIQMVYAVHSEKLQDHIFSLIHQKSVRLDLAFYEQPDFFDHLHRALIEARSRPIELTTQLGSFLQNTITLLAMGTLLLSFGLWLPLVLIISSIPAFYVVLRNNLRLHAWQREKTVEERKAAYFSLLQTSGDAAAELRLFGLGDYFRQNFLLLRGSLRKERLNLTLKQKVSELLAGFISLVLTAAAFVWIIWQTIQGFGTFGDLALFYQAFNQGQNLARSFLQDAGKFYANNLFIGDLFEFLALEPKIKNPPNPAQFELAQAIRFENVSFAYQDGARKIFTDLSLQIPAGRVTAIVGENGAGKSTLVKLICRFYEVENGAIKFDNQDIRAFNLEDLRTNITVLFQTPMRFNLSVETNVKLGNINAENNLEEIEKAADSAGASGIIEKLPNQYSQILGHKFPGGTELSVGEWQRIALARAFYRQSPIILLDEPTSAMDPWAEADWLNRLFTETKGKTLLLITHRFTTARRADLIYVMENGQIVESGNHEELLEKRGLYEKSWNEQTKAQKA